MTRLAGSHAVTRLERALRAGAVELDAALSDIGVHHTADREAVRELLSTQGVVLRADVNRDGDDVIWLVPGAIEGVHRVGLMHADGHVQHLRIAAA